MTTIITGQSFSIEIGAVVYDAQVTEVMCTSTQTINRATTIGGSPTWRGPETWQLRVRGFQDYGEAGSFCDAMWTAAAAGTLVAFELTDNNGDTWTGSFAPVYPAAGGAADQAAEFDLTLEVDGAVVKA